MSEDIGVIYAGGKGENRNQRGVVILID